MTNIAWFITSFSCIILCFAAIAFLRAKDLFTMSHVVMIANCYLLPLVLLGIELERFSVSSSLKIFFFVILNIVISNLICYLILREAIAHKIMPDADEKR